MQADGRLISVPGNHDCLGDDVSGAIMPGPRVQSACYPGLYVVRVNSTGPHNRSWLNGHGSLDDDDLNAIDVALDAAPAGHLVVIALHHHVLPMPEEHAMERLSSWLGFIFTAELPRGRDLLARVRGRCDLVLHGHRHVPRGARLFGPPRPMHVFNAGSSTELARVRVFAHDGAGPCWAARCGWTFPRRGRTPTRRSPATATRRAARLRRGTAARASRDSTQAPGCSSHRTLNGSRPRDELRRASPPPLDAIRNRLPASTTRRFQRH